MDEKKLTIEPKLTADLHGFGSASTKPLSIHEWGAIKRQAAMYAQGIFESYRGVRPMPAGVINHEAIREAEEAFLRHYSSRDTAFTMDWWNRVYSRPILVNRLTRAEYMSYNDLIRPETLAAMGRPKWGIESLRVRTVSGRRLGGYRWRG